MATAKRQAPVAVHSARGCANARRPCVRTLRRYGGEGLIAHAMHPGIVDSNFASHGDQAMQTHGGIGYTRHQPFEHIYRHHRRYRITEGSEEIQMRRIAQVMFGFGQPRE